MKLDILKEHEPQQQGPQRPSVVISTQLKRERVVLDRDGNEIDPRTKQIIRRAEN